MDFHQVPVDTRDANQFVLLANDGDEPLLVEADVAVPFRIENPLPIRIEPGETAALSIAFTPSKVGEATARLDIKPVGGERHSLTLRGEGIAYTMTGPATWLTATITALEATQTMETTRFTGWIDIELKPGMDPALINGSVRYRLNEAAGADIAGLDELAAMPVLHLQEFSFDRRTDSLDEGVALQGSVELLDENGDLMADYPIPEFLWQQDPTDREEPPCACPPGAGPAPVQWSQSTSYFPRRFIPRGEPAGPSRNKLLKVTSTMRGPAANTCCEKGRDVDMIIQIASNFTLPNGTPFNNEFSAQLLLRGCRGIDQFEVEANTNGRPQVLRTVTGSSFDCPTPPVNRPLPKFREKMGAIILETSASLPIRCKQDKDCPCVVTKAIQTTTINYVAKNRATRIGLGAKINAASYVFWRAAFLRQPNTADCHTDKPLGVILRTLHTHGRQVIDPTRMDLGWLFAFGDPDKDGRNNIEELARGFDPRKPD